MLTIAPRFPAPVPLVRRSVRCVALAYRLQDGRPYQLGADIAGSAWGALLWLSWRTAHIADQLDATAGVRARAALADGAERNRVLACLAEGSPYALLFSDGSVHYLLSASPVGEKGETALAGTGTVAPRQVRLDG
ncbi:hypothetical protein PJ985_00440 [Streptomyces sp. ACA25]|uniref:hypothetical protein n=1 Tax=Streptomyces sp. ACA25 TaxID=3022596 RepID=UPI0023079805|nr:hypothetical protein [Streptomyces sp. ACA25]MDB1086050.1 hypothetical protein [Streptomyces sp. ACA25]